jgi:hypothetical protein
MEETPRYEGAASTTPYRISTYKAFLPVQSLGVQPNPQLIDRSDELRGIEGAPDQLIDTYEIAGSLQMRNYFNLLTYLLEISGMVGTLGVGNGIITDPDGAVIPTGAFRWVFTKRGGITAKTAQLQMAYVDEAVFVKGQGVGISNWTLNADGQYTADLMGLVFANVADPNLTPVFDSAVIPHGRRGDISLTWLASSGTTEDFSLAVSNPLMRRRTLGISPASYYPDKMEHGDDKVALTGSIPKTVLADADVDALLAASTFAATAKWITPKSIGATSKKYSMWVEMPRCQYIGGTLDDLANRRRFGGSFDWRASWDETAGYDFKITLVNAVPAIAGYV